jgi:hypothetical protein
MLFRERCHLRTTAGHPASLAGSLYRSKYSHNALYSAKSCDLPLTEESSPTSLSSFGMCGIDDDFVPCLASVVRTETWRSMRAILMFVRHVSGLVRPSSPSLADDWIFCMDVAMRS